MKRVSNLPCLAKLLLVLLTTTTGTAEQCEFCNARWRKVYEINDKGRAVSGKYRRLWTAVKRAEPIRYIIPSLGEKGYAANSDMTSSSHGVFFMSTSYVSKASWKTFEEEPYHRLLRFNRNGMILETRYYVNNFTEVSHKVYKAGIQWFAKKSSCVSMVLQHARNGKVSRGSVHKVISSVVSGHDIMETWNNKITQPCRNVEVTDAVSVLGQFLWYTTLSQNQLWSFLDIYTSGSGKRSSFKPGDTHIRPLKMKVSGRWFADSCWKHVFTNDENGDGVDGSLSDLTCAVIRGHRVKVIMGNFSIEADNVKIKSGQISAQLLNRVYAENVEGKYKGVWFWQMAHTTGSVATLKYWLFGGSSVGEGTEKKKIKWFVDTKPWKNVFSTNENGDVVFGSKSELRTAVENGAEVRVAVQIDDSKPASNTPKKREVVCWENAGQGGCLWDRHDRPCGGNAKPDGGQGKPGEGNGKPEEGTGKPDEGTGKPDEGTGKPDEGNGKPDEGTGKPDEGNGRPDEGTGKPDEGNGKPDEGNGKPDEGNGKPDEGNGKPDEGNGKPDEGNGKPDEGTGKPDEGIGKPDEGNGKPDEGNGKPDEGNGKPDEGNGKPDEGNGKPDEGNGKTDEGNGGQGGGHGGSDECMTQGWALFKTSNLELGPSGEVSAELLQSVSTEEVGLKEFKIKKDAYWKYMIVTTQGDVDVSQRGIGVNRNDGHFSVKHAIKWFVNY